MKKIFKFVIICIYLTTASFSTIATNSSNKTQKNPCTIGIFLKQNWSGTISILDWSDDDYGYLFYNLVYNDHASSTFDNTSPIVINVSLPSSHPSGHFAVRDSNTGTLLYCVNFTSTQSNYSYTITSPSCGTPYIVEIEDGSC